jgi:hypothetical protein
MLLAANGAVTMYHDVAVGAGLTVTNTVAAANVTVSDNSVLHMGMGADAVGSFAMAKHLVGSMAFGGTTSGGSLQPCDAVGNSAGDALNGTWRCLGYAALANAITLWQRIA